MLSVLYVFLGSVDIFQFDVSSPAGRKQERSVALGWGQHPALLLPLHHPHPEGVRGVASDCVDPGDGDGQDVLECIGDHQLL